MCAALRREPHFENHPPSIRKALPNIENVRSAKARTHFENHPPSIRETLALFKTSVRGSKATATF
eukprot:7923415-Pyramimonas_sp.AAC.1